MNKKKRLKIGILGCGAIGTSLSLLIKERYAKKIDIAALCDLDRGKAQALKRKLNLKSIMIVSFKKLIRLSDLVVEAASAKISFAAARQALRHKKDVLIMSVGGVLGREKELFKIAAGNKRRLYFPSGAICGLDGVKALGLAGIVKISLSTYKPPLALQGADYLVQKKIRLDTMRRETLIFSGTAYEAVKAFPQNINVVALLTLAVKGDVVPEVKIFASPGLARNRHKIEIESPAARIEINCENVPSPDNPKTSYLAVLSALESINGIIDSIKIGT